MAIFDDAVARIKLLEERERNLAKINEAAREKAARLIERVHRDEHLSPEEWDCIRKNSHPTVYAQVRAGQEVRAEARRVARVKYVAELRLRAREARQDKPRRLR